MSSILTELQNTLNNRKLAEKETSYVASLYAKGDNAILKKIGEETTELVMAAKSGNHKEIVHETADLWFHTLVLLSHLGLSLDDVLTELERRQGQSGLEEKAGRAK